MASLAELARAHTLLDESAIGHLQRLVATWALPCDLAFADLLLLAPCDDPITEFIVLGHVRSATGAAVHGADPVADRIPSELRPMLARCYREGRRSSGLIDSHGSPSPAVDDTVEETVVLPSLGGHLTVDYLPVRMGDRIIGVLTREGEPGLIRHRGIAETVYRRLWERYATMVEEGSFPLANQERVGQFREPRVGDGVIVFDRERRIDFASPNALSALHRLGVQAKVEGRTLAEVGIDDSVVRRALATRNSTVAEMEHGDDLTVVVRCYPFIKAGRATGALGVLRDVSELRSRDRLLLSKDTTIREIHHRVKNNLQTIQSLLRLQARRLEGDEAKEAVEQSARRIGSIAIVHETLSTNATDVVNFGAVVDRLVSLVEEGFTAPERPMRVNVDGSLGELAGEQAMPLAVALAELMQNAVDHAASCDAEVRVQLRVERRDLVVRVENDGPGLVEGFSLDRDAGLGLTIVRTFVVHDLGGTISIGPIRESAPCGAAVELRVPRRLEAAPLG